MEVVRDRDWGGGGGGGRRTLVESGSEAARVKGATRYASFSSSPLLLSLAEIAYPGLILKRETPISSPHSITPISRSTNVPKISSNVDSRPLLSPPFPSKALEEKSPHDRIRVIVRSCLHESQDRSPKQPIQCCSWPLGYAARTQREIPLPSLQSSRRGSSLSLAFEIPLFLASRPSMCIRSLPPSFRSPPLSSPLIRIFIHPFPLNYNVFIFG